MKNIYKYLSLLVFAGISLNGQAQGLGQASVVPTPDDDYFIINGGCGTELYYVSLKWDTDAPLSLDSSLKATVQITSEEPGVNTDVQEITTYWWDETWEEEEEGHILILNIQKLVAPSWENIFGTYTIQLPEGLVTDGSATSASQTLTFTVYDFFLPRQRTIEPRISEEWLDDSFTSFPPPTYTADELSEVTINWDGVTDLQLYPVREPMTATNSETDEVINLEDKVKISNNSLVIDLSSLSEGLWQIYLPQGYVTGDNYGDMSTTKAYTFPYIIHGVLPPMTDYQVVTPATPEMLTSLTQIKLSFTGQEIIFTNPRENQDYISDTKVTVSFGGSDYEISPTIDYDSYNNVFYLVINFLNQANSADYPGGEYSVSIPAGIVKNADGELNEDINLEYTVYKVFSEDDSEININPEQGEINAEDLTVVEITFADFDEIEINSLVEEKPTITVVSTNGEPVVTDLQVVTEENTLVLPLQGIELTGSVTIVIPQYYIIADTYYMANEIEIEYTIEEEDNPMVGVNAVKDYNKTDCYTVYNMQGLKLIETNNKSDLNSLPRGIYIINGKKVTLN